MVTPEIMQRWRTALIGRERELEDSALGFSNLLGLMAHLRSPDGCPWDREQSLASLRQYIREEAGEVVSAIDRVLEIEARLRQAHGMPAADPAPPDGEDKARTDKKGHTIAHHPHRAEFNAAHSASGAPLPDQLADTEREQLDSAYAHLHEEIGDLLLQSAFLGDILWAMGRPGVDHSLKLIVNKLIHRHPHVYGDREVSDSAEVLKNWEDIKRAERNAIE